MRSSRRSEPAAGRRTLWRQRAGGDQSEPLSSFHAVDFPRGVGLSLGAHERRLPHSGPMIWRQMGGFIRQQRRARLRVSQMTVFFFLKIPSRGRFLSQPPWNPSMAKPIKKSHRRKASPPARGPAPRDGGSNAAHSGSGFGARRGGCRTRRAHGATHTTDHRADAEEPRDRSAGRLRLTRRPIITESIGRIHRSPSLRGALATRGNPGAT
jgi:hypothetical protein